MIVIVAEYRHFCGTSDATTLEKELGMLRSDGCRLELLLCQNRSVGWLLTSRFQLVKRGNSSEISTGLSADSSRVSLQCVDAVVRFSAVTRQHAAGSRN